MYTIVTASQKGGSGKTTLSGHLAVEAERAGAGPVVIIDTDPQGSLAHWWNARAQPAPQFVKAGLLDLGDALAELKKAGAKLVFIDTPPAITSSISHVVGYADLVIVPTRPSPHDLRAVGATVDIAERHQKPLIFVLNAATPRARITAESAVALSQHGTVAPVTIHHRVDFAASMVDGRTVGEILPRSASAKEISELWSYIQFRLSRLMRDPQMLPKIMPKDQSVAPLLTALEEDALPEETPPPVLVEESQTVKPPPAVVEEVPTVKPPPAIVEEVPTVEPPPFYSGPERRLNPPSTPYFGVDRRVNPQSTFGRRSTHPPHHEETGGRK